MIMDQEPISKYNFDLLEDSNLRVLARVGRVVTQEKFKDDRSWVKFGCRALQINFRSGPSRQVPRVVVVGSWNDNRVGCLLESSTIVWLPYEDMFWLPSIEDYMTFEEWPGNVYNSLHGSEWWILDPEGKVQRVGLYAPAGGRLEMSPVTEQPNGAWKPDELLVSVALAWLKAWCESSGVSR